MTVEACLHLLVLVDFYVCSGPIKNPACGKGGKGGAGDTSILRTGGKQSSHFVEDFAIPVLLSERRES